MSELKTLTTEKLAERWGCKEQTVRKNYPAWGLRPLRFGKRLLFDERQIEEIENKRLGRTEA